VALVYPKIPTGGAAEQPVSTTTVFEQIIVENVVVLGLEMDARGLARSAGVLTMGHNLAAGLRTAFPHVL
jgi:hypothetical protein